MWYISGKITGDKNYKKKFADTEEYIKKQYNEKAINPTTIMPDGLSWCDYMKVDLLLVRLCNTIYMLRDWKESKGAILELETAVIYNKRVIFQDHEKDIVAEKKFMEQYSLQDYVLGKE